MINGKQIGIITSILASCTICLALLFSMATTAYAKPLSVYVIEKKKKEKGKKKVIATKKSKNKKGKAKISLLAYLEAMIENMKKEIQAYVINVTTNNLPIPEQGPMGPQGPKGDPGPGVDYSQSKIVQTTQLFSKSGEAHELSVQCPEGYIVTNRSIFADVNGTIYLTTDDRGTATNIAYDGWIAYITSFDKNPFTAVLEVNCAPVIN